MAITPLAATPLGDVGDHARRLLSHTGLRISEVVRVDVGMPCSGRAVTVGSSAGWSTIAR